MKLTVAAVQTFSKLGDTEANLKSVLQLTREAAENGANLIVFPGAFPAMVYLNRCSTAPSLPAFR